MVSNCSTCIRFKQPPARPVVGFCKGTDFNQTVSVDLKELVPHRLWYLHIIDEFTKFTNAVLINKKSISAIAFMKG